MQSRPQDLIASLLPEESFFPTEPRNLEDVGVPETIVDALMLKRLSFTGTQSGRSIAEDLCLPFGIVEPRLTSCRTRQLVTHVGSAPLNDYLYSLTEHGRERARAHLNASGYVGPVPVPLQDYVTSVDAQTISAESPRREHLEKAFQDISVTEDLFDRLGPAINSGAGLFLYGAAGNGKTTIAERITLCFGNHIWIPHALISDGQIFKLFDPQYHAVVGTQQQSIMKEDHDRRWVKIRRPTVVAGGELTMDSLEIRHDMHTNTSEAPLQLNSNCGTLLIDDFGRQRMNPSDLLNRWIVPLEKHYDFLTLASGKKIQVPFDQLIIFSTNLEPKDLVDEAFLRRIPYKINISDPDETEFHRLFQAYARKLGCEYNRFSVEHLLVSHYRPLKRPLRRCHPRDLLVQIKNYCAYHGLPLEMNPDYFDKVVENYFTVVG